MLGFAQQEGKGENTRRVLTAGEGSEEDLGNWRKAAAVAQLTPGPSESGQRGEAWWRGARTRTWASSCFFCSFFFFLLANMLMRCNGRKILNGHRNWWHNVTYLFIFILFIKFKVHYFIDNHDIYGIRY